MKFSEVFSEKKVNKVSSKTVIGIDIGSRQSKAVLLHNNEIYTAIIPTGFFMQETGKELLEQLYQKSHITEDDVDYIVSTGYGRIALSFEHIPNQIVTEISCHGMGASYLGTDIHTIIDIGGQDSKVIRIDPDTGVVLNFVMNDKCAAGTGRFLESIAKVLGIDVTQMGEISLRASEVSQISSQCIVFAESEVVSGRAKGEEISNLAAGIHQSVARRVNGLLNRVGIEPNVLFTGGVSNNVGVQKALEDVLGFPIQKAKINTVFAGALGAALYAGQYAEQSICTEYEQKEEQVDLTSLKAAVEGYKKAYIEKSTGKKKNIASLCAYTPIEIMEAANVAHTRLLHAGNQRELSAGEAITQSVFCDFTKSILGSFSEKNPYFESIDHVYTVATCDCMRTTVEAINTRFKPGTSYSLPRLRHNDDSKDYLISELHAFKDDLEEFTGEKIEDATVRENIDKYNFAKELICEISNFRKYDIPLLSSGEFQKICQAYYYLPIDILTEELKKIVHSLRKKEIPEGERKLRLMVSGGIVAEEDTKITDLVEKELGARIVVEDNCSGLKQFLFRVKNEQEDVYADLAEGYLGQAPCARMKPIDEMIQVSVDLAKEYRVDGIIYKYMKFCPCYSIVIRKFIDEFVKIGIPVLVIAGDYAGGDDGQVKTRLEAFVEVLNERRESL